MFEIFHHKKLKNRLLLLLSRFSRVRLCATPQMAAHQAPLSLGFSRQEHWSGLPFPSLMHESEKWKWSCSAVSDSSRHHGLQPTRLLRPWDFSGKSTGEWVDRLFSAKYFLLKQCLLQLHNSKASVLQCSAFFMVQLSHPYVTTGKTIALTIWTFVGKAMSLLFNMLSRFVVAFQGASIF